MECVVVHDLFLNETANYAHVFLPGCDVPGEGRHVHQRRTPHQPGAQGDGAARRHGGLGSDAGDRQRDGLQTGTTRIRREIMDEIARTTPTFAGVSFEKLEHGSVQWPCNDKAPEGTPIMHIGRLRARQGQLRHHRIRADRREGRAALPAAADHRAHPVAVQRRRADPAHRECRVASTRTCWRSIRTTPRSAASRDGDWVRLASRVRRDDAARADHRSGGAGRGLHDVPSPGDAGQRGHHRLFRLGDQLPGIQGDGGAGVAVATGRASGRTSIAS